MKKSKFSDTQVVSIFKEAEAVLATVIYHAANAEELMPRKPLPNPWPAMQDVPKILRN